MVWGAIRREGMGPLYKIDGTMDQVYFSFCESKVHLDSFLQEKYKEVLKMALKDIPALQSGRATLQQDNAPCHTAQSIERFLSKNNATVLPWPANSPDLSPIENVWSCIAKKLQGMAFRNADALFEAISHEWHQFPLETLQKLYDSMPHRLMSVRRARGAAIRY